MLDETDYGIEANPAAEALVGHAREQTGDIVRLARHLVGRLGSATGRHGLSLSKQAEERLTGYTWRRNIREIEKCDSARDDFSARKCDGG